ncbi:MAG TPA: hypothetical protein PLU72_19150 [Candidatus Ozemobacteraceae bacterium]|nr:hypothetical protein [Candidatus Ozemobacteraceae bacterium]HQG29828.1 hypothetical protein [Candidatus Ozemobacteraceae bacterium]
MLCAAFSAQCCDVTHEWQEIQSLNPANLPPDLAFLELSFKLRSALASEATHPDVTVVWPEAAEFDSPVPLPDEAPGDWTIPPDIRDAMAPDGIDPSGFWRKKSFPLSESALLCSTLERVIGGKWHPSPVIPASGWMLHVSCPERSTNIAWNKDIRTPGMYGLSRLDRAVMRVCLRNPAGDVRLIEEYSLKSLAEAHFADIASGGRRLLGLLVQAGFPPLLRRETVARPIPDPTIRGESQ